MSASFDGSATYLLRSTPLKGVSDAKTGTFACWVKRGATGASGACNLLSIGPSTGFFATFVSSDVFRILGYTSGGTKILQLTSSALTSTSNWYHIVASWDLGAGTTHLYVDRTSDNSEDTATDGTIDYTTTASAIGAGTTGSAKFTGLLEDLLLWPGVYVDLSDADVLKKFVSSDALSVTQGDYTTHVPSGVKPVGYGHDASIPTNGTPPALFYANGWRKNLGTGGAFALQSAFASQTAPGSVPNAYRDSALWATPGERWFRSERSTFVYPRSQTFVENREGHPDFGKRLGLDERDEDTRDVGPLRAVSVATLVRGGDEEDEDDTRMI